MFFFIKIKRFLRKKNIYFKAAKNKKSVKILSLNEKMIIQKAVIKRQIEFASARWCAKKLLKKLKFSNIEILQGKDGEPIFPDKICGSISHTKNAFAAAIAYKKYYISIGIDIEDRRRKISQEAISHFMNNDEKDVNIKNDILGKIIFSAKESVFKLLFPIVKKKFYFQDVSIFPDLRNKTFKFILKKDLSNSLKKGYTGTGYFFYNKKWIFTICFTENNI